MMRYGPLARALALLLQSALILTGNAGAASWKALRAQLKLPPSYDGGFEALAALDKVLRRPRLGQARFNRGGSQSQTAHRSG